MSSSSSQSHYATSSPALSNAASSTSHRNNGGHFSSSSSSSSSYAAAAATVPSANNSHHHQQQQQQPRYYSNSGNNNQQQQHLAYAKFQSRLKKSLDGHLAPSNQQQQYANAFRHPAARSSSNAAVASVRQHPSSRGAVYSSPTSSSTSQHSSFPFFQHPVLNINRSSSVNQQQLFHQQSRHRFNTSASRGQSPAHSFTAKHHARRVSDDSDSEDDEDEDDESDDETTAPLPFRLATAASASSSDNSHQVRQGSSLSSTSKKRPKTEIEHQLKKKKMKAKQELNEHPDTSTNDTTASTTRTPESREEKLAKLRGRSFFRSPTFSRGNGLAFPMQHFANITNKSSSDDFPPLGSTFREQQMRLAAQSAAPHGVNPQQMMVFQNYMKQMSMMFAQQQQGSDRPPHHPPMPSPQHQQEMMMHFMQLQKQQQQQNGSVPSPSKLDPLSKDASLSSEERDEVQNKVKHGDPRMKKAWNHLLNTKKSVLIRIDELSEYLFRSTDATALRATLQLLEKHKTLFKQVSPRAFECHSVREVERIEKQHQKQINEQFQRHSTLAKVASILSHRTKSTSSSSPRHNKYKLILDRQIARLKELKPEVVGDTSSKQREFYDHLCKDMQFTKSDHEVLQSLKHYALGISCSNSSSVVKGAGSKNGADSPVVPSPEKNSIQQVHQLIMEPLGVSKDTASAFELCRQLNLFESDNVPLLRTLHLHPNHFKIDFPKKVLEEARAIKSQLLTLPDPDAKSRKDFRSLPAFAIDDEDTLEVDDAISVKPLPDGRLELYVHIADATRYINPKDNINDAAFERVSSIYLPDKKVPMLPCELGVDVLSLSSERENDALTFIATINTEGVVEDCQVVPSKISRVKRWTYEHFDSHLQEQAQKNPLDTSVMEHMKSLLHAANLRLKHRLKSGARNVSLTGTGASDISSSVSLDPQNNIHLKARIHSRHSRRIVEEFMIVANEVSAKFAAQNNIVIPYRGTHGSKKADSLAEDDIDAIVNAKPILTADDLIERMKARGFHVDVEERKNHAAGMFSSPRPHNTLGVSAYTFATSPLRRYIDLLVHHQIKCWLRGNQPLTWDEIQNQLNRVEPKQRQILSLQRESTQFWTLKYFEKRQGDTFDGIVCGIDSILSDSLSERAMLVDILLPEQGYHTKIRVQRDVGVGDRLNVKCVSASASTVSARFIEA